MSGRREVAVSGAVPGSGAFGPAAVGLGVWGVGLLLVPAPLAARIFLLAPLVVVPRLVGFLPERAWIGRLAPWPLLVAALPLVAAFSVAPGPLAGAATVPWLLCAFVGLGSAMRHGLAGLPSILSPRRLPELGVDAALAFWAVGAVFATLGRCGVDTGLSSTIILLTATHFHFAGLGLLGVTSLVAASRRWVSASVAGLVVGIPLTAAGFVLVSNHVSAVGALVVGVSGIGAAVALLMTRAETPPEWLFRVAGGLLLVGMPMGIAWSFAILATLSFLDLDTMVRTHGAVNATAVLLAVLGLREGGLHGWSPDRNETRPADSRRQAAARMRAAGESVDGSG